MVHGVTREVHDLLFQKDVYLLEQFLPHGKHSELCSFLLGPVDNSPEATLIESQLLLILRPSSPI